MRVWQRSRRRMFSLLREEKQRARERASSHSQERGSSHSHGLQRRTGEVQCYRIIAFPLLHVSCHEVTDKLYMNIDLVPTCLPQVHYCQYTYSNAHVEISMCKLQYIPPLTKTCFGFKIIKYTYVPLLLALPTPRTFMAIGSDMAPISSD